MCLIKCAFVGEKNFNIIKMHGTTIKKERLFIAVVCNAAITLYAGGY
jgi:hypothetical protein